MYKTLLCFLASLSAIIPLASVSAQQPAPAPAPPSAERAYILGAGDVIELEVLGQPEFGKPRVRVRPDGTIPLPMIGPIPAADRTLSEVASAVERRLIEQQLYTTPSVNADIVSYASRYVVVLGAVGQPGLVPVDRPYRVSEILARVAGAKEGSQVVILSSPNGQQRRLPITSLAHGVADDPFVSPDDKLFVPEPEQFYIYGQVNAPGAYPLRDGMTLRQALARGGGLTASGSEKRLTLYRGEQKLKESPDTKLQPGDVVVVGERLF